MAVPSDSDDDDAERREREATAWFVRLQDGDLDEAQRRRFRDWRAGDPRRHDAFNAVKRLWSDLDEPAARLGADGWHRQGLPATRSWPSATAVAAVCACVLAVSGLALWRDAGLIDRLRADHATSPGEHREVALADGSRVYLDGDSAISVTMAPGRRDMTLLRGRIWLEVKPDPTRPFAVASGAVETRVLGTTFAIDRDGPATDVTVEHGWVAVATSGAALELTAGQQVRAQAGRLGLAKAVEPETVLAWRRGLIVLDQAPLSRVVEELERMQPGRVIIRDAALRQLRLSGVFRADDPDAVIEAMQSALGLGIVRLPGLATLVYR